jgi:hypothetical protein
MYAMPSPVLFRGGEVPGQGLLLEDQERSEGDEPDRRMLLCRTCGQPVTRSRDRVEANGKHLHALFNPAGILFEVGCFAQAPGCRFEGEFTLEFTWFPGHAWRFALCRQCGAHLGWEYQGAASGFVGLIVTELRES